MKLNQDAKIVLRDAGVSQATWARANFMADGKWCGDACGSPDDRCKDGYHHFPDDECGCLRVLLEQYLRGEGTFAEYPKDAAELTAACPDHRPVLDSEVGWYCTACGSDAPPASQGGQA